MTARPDDDERAARITNELNEEENWMNRKRRKDSGARRQIHRRSLIMMWKIELRDLSEHVFRVLERLFLA